MPSDPGVTVVDVAFRDGLQNDPADLSTEAKLEGLIRLAGAGVTRAEVTSFVSPRAVPKMADAEALMAAAVGNPHLAGVSLIGLVVNEPGVERALRSGVSEINAVVLASDTFNRRNQGEGTDDTLRRIADLMSAARSGGVGVSVTIGASFGCPFEGEVPVGRLAEVVAAVAACRPDEIALADTIGVAVPVEVERRFAAAREAAGTTPAGGTGGAPTWRAHFHNTRNTGYANAVAAIGAGVGALDSSLGGVGGCPFAPAATGNIATEDLVYLLERSGIATGLDLDGVVAAAGWFESVLGHAVPGAMTKVAPFPDGHP